MKRTKEPTYSRCSTLSLPPQALKLAIPMRPVAARIDVAHLRFGEWPVLHHATGSFGNTLEGIGIARPEALEEDRSKRTSLYPEGDGYGKQYIGNYQAHGITPQRQGTSNRRVELP